MGKICLLLRNRTLRILISLFRRILNKSSYIRFRYSHLRILLVFMIKYKHFRSWRKGVGHYMFLSRLSHSLMWRTHVFSQLWNLKMNGIEYDCRLLLLRLLIWVKVIVVLDVRYRWCNISYVVWCSSCSHFGLLWRNCYCGILYQT